MEQQIQQAPKKSGVIAGLIASVVLALGGAAGGYFHAYSQPQHWKATAKLEAPKVADLGNYYSLFSTYQIVQMDGRADPNIEKNLTEMVFNEFKRRFVSAENRQQFLTDNETIKSIAAAYNKPIAEMVAHLNEKLTFDESTNSLSLALINPEQAKKVLEDYVALNGEEARKTLNNDLISKWQFLFQNVKRSADANLGESWKGKLEMMKSVQALDNKLQAYSFAQKPTAALKAEEPENLWLSVGIGGAIGLFLGLLFALIRRK